MWVRQAFDGAAIAEVAVDDAGNLAQKLEQAIRCFADRPGWLPAHKRIEILRRLARLMEREFDTLAMLITTGGTRISDRVYAPTVIVEPSAEARVSREEVFGPVTCVYAYSDLDQAIARANSLPFAFQSSVFARDLGVALKAARSLDASTVLVNDHTAFRTDWMPFAGRRQSGYGVGGIPYTMHDMTHEKMIVLMLK